MRSCGWRGRGCPSEATPGSGTPVSCKLVARMATYLNLCKCGTMETCVTHELVKIRATRAYVPNVMQLRYLVLCSGEACPRTPRHATASRVPNIRTAHRDVSQTIFPNRGARALCTLISAFSEKCKTTVPCYLAHCTMCQVMTVPSICSPSCSSRISASSQPFRIPTLSIIQRPWFGSCCCSWAPQSWYALLDTPHARLLKF